MGRRSRGRTTKGSDTAKRMLDRRAPLSLPMARTSSRKGGFCPDSIASELPARHAAHHARVSQKPGTPTMGSQQIPVDCHPQPASELQAMLSVPAPTASRSFHS